jgi:hypothetical protein
MEVTYMEPPQLVSPFRWKTLETTGVLLIFTVVRLLLSFHANECT